MHWSSAEHPSERSHPTMSLTPQLFIQEPVTEDKEGCKLVGSPDGAGKTMFGSLVGVMLALASGTETVESALDARSDTTWAETSRDKKRYDGGERTKRAGPAGRRTQSSNPAIAVVPIWASLPAHLLPFFRDQRLTFVLDTTRSIPGPVSCIWDWWSMRVCCPSAGRSCRSRRPGRNANGPSWAPC
jgi:hypothetical protein